MVERQARPARDAFRLDRASSLGQLTGSIAHELNQPLTGILGNAQAAQLLLRADRWRVDELAEILAEIVADAKRAGAVIRNLRDLYREQVSDLVPVDLNAVVAETMQLLHSEMVVKHITSTAETTASLPTVSGNAVQLQQVLVNLIMNGIQAMHSLQRQERRIRVVTAHEGHEARVWVEDNGPGIDPTHIDRIFEPLATWKPGGTGIGLAVSQSIVRAHHGTMWARNLASGGAQVGFGIPCTTKVG